MESIRVLAVIPGHRAQRRFIFARRQLAQIRELGYIVEPFFLSSRTHPIKVFNELLRYRRAIRLFNPDVIHAHYGTVTALFTVIFSRQPVVITFRGSDLNPSSEFCWLRNFTSRLFSQIAAIFAREIICVSPQLRDRLWWRKGRVEVILTGVDLDVFCPIDRDKARQKLGWSNKNKIVLFNHGVVRAPNKRRDLVDSAISLLRSRIDSVTLIVMDGDIPGGIVPLYINAADAVVMTSDYEGSPNIVKEALACNVPVCSVRVGDVVQLLSGVDFCRLVDRNPSAIADGLYELIEKPLRSNGRNFADWFSAQTNTKRVCSVLARAADRKVGSPIDLQ